MRCLMLAKSEDGKYICELGCLKNIDVNDINYKSTHYPTEADMKDFCLLAEHRDCPRVELFIRIKDPAYVTETE